MQFSLLRYFVCGSYISVMQQISTSCFFLFFQLFKLFVSAFKLNLRLNFPYFFGHTMVMGCLYLVDLCYVVFSLFVVKRVSFMCIINF